MIIDKIDNLGKEYDFLKTNPKLKNLCYLVYFGSISYGTNNENSDIDIRGFLKENLSDIVLNKPFEVYEDKNTDTVIYGLRKFINLCKNCNPSVLELLGVKDEHIIYRNEFGRLIRENRDKFLSKRCFKTYVGYATAQLRRLQNALAHDKYNQEEEENHILKSIQSMMLVIEDQYKLNKGDIKFFIKDSQVYVSVNIDSISLRQFNAINGSIYTMLNNYDKLNNRNRKKDDKHLFKHAMHLIRLYLTCLDILEKGELITYRENELDLLRSIRNGEMKLEDIFKLVDKLDERLKKVYLNSKLPDYCDEEGIEKLLIKIYEVNN